MEDALIRFGFGLLAGIAIAVPAVGMTLMWTSGRVLNLAYGELMTLGAFIAYELWSFFPAPLVLIAAAIVPAATACMMYLAVFQWLRKREVFVSLVASLGLAYLLNNLIIAGWGTDIRRFDLPIFLNQSVHFGWFQATPLLLILGLASCLVVLAVGALLYRTDFGLRARAASQHPELAAVSGVGILRVTLCIWALSGAQAGLGGAVIGMSSAVMPTLGATLLLVVAASIVLGGLGSPIGAVLGALTIGVCTELSTIWLKPSLKPAVAFALLALILLFRPGGITGQTIVTRYD